MGESMTIEGTSADEYTRNLLKIIGERYSCGKLTAEVTNADSSLYSKDIYICLKNIVEAAIFAGVTDTERIEALKEAKNIYKGPIFGLGFGNPDFLIKSVPDFDKIVSDLKTFDKCFEMNVYNIVNTVLALVKAQVTGYDMSELFKQGLEHINGFIKSESISTTDAAKLIIPVGAAGCGKSTFYRELKNVVNISCDNVRYMLFKSHGPCFAAWESTLSWWVVNTLTDYYLNKGYSVFYNGVNTDVQYRSQMSMEVSDSLFEGLSYNIQIVYFEPPVQLSAGELEELKSTDLWGTPLDKLDFDSLSDNVRTIMEMIRDNVNRTLARTKDIREGVKDQDPFDVLYSVPAPIVKLFVEQNFDRPNVPNVTVVPRKNIPDEKERTEFYRNFAQQVQTL